MAMAMVSTPDAAMDIFRDCWDKQADKDLYQAYQRLSSITPTSSYSKQVAPATVQQTTYIPITTSYIPTPVYTTIGIPSSYSTPSTSSYIPAPCPTPPSYAGGSSTPSQCSPHSGGSPGARDQYEGSAGAATSEVTKIALMLISQSNKKPLSHEEEEKRRIRRERNKIAATKCRIKRRAHTTNVDHEYKQVVATTRKLEEQIGVFQREKEELKKLLENHHCHKPNTPGLGPSVMTPGTPFSIAELFIKPEPETPSLKQEMDPFN